MSRSLSVAATTIALMTLLFISVGLANWRSVSLQLGLIALFSAASTILQLREHA